MYRSLDRGLVEVRTRVLVLYISLDIGFGEESARLVAFSTITGASVH